MTHDEALREMLTEQYVLGELESEARDEYEEHLFGCELCAADLRAAQLFADGVRQEGRAMATVTAAEPVRANWVQRLFSPWLTGPALAACLLLLAFQVFVVRPKMELAVAEARTPGFLNSLVLAAGSSRGVKAIEVTAPKNGAFLLEVDVPGEAKYTGYRCSLYSPAGEKFWTGDLSAEQAGDTVSLRVPVARTAAGVNALVVEGIVKGTREAVVIARHPFELTVK